MFVREKKNASGSVSILIISKEKGRYKVVKTIGSATVLQKIEELKKQAHQEIKELKKQL